MVETHLLGARAGRGQFGQRFWRIANRGLANWVSSPPLLDSLPTRLVQSSSGLPPLSLLLRPSLHLAINNSPRMRQKSINLCRRILLSSSTAGSGKPSASPKRGMFPVALKKSCMRCRRKPEWVPSCSF